MYCGYNKLSDVCIHGALFLGVPRPCIFNCLLYEVVRFEIMDMRIGCVAICGLFWFSFSKV